MKLQPEQRDRFYNIFMQFFGFSIYYLTERGLFMVPDFDDSHVKWKDARVIFDLIWGEGGHLEVIDAFVDHPRTPLNRSDKDVVLGWREGIYGRFTACRQGCDVVFLYGDYAFCVCGITDEIDDGTPVFPRFINTVIVPFDGIITPD